MFPALNREHVENFDLEVINRDNEIEMLRKRVEEMSQIETKLNKQLSSLREENQRLLHSSKSWYGRYQELAELKEPALWSQFATPFKKNPKSNFDLFDGSL